MRDKLLKTERPSAIARSWQGSGKYPGMDDYEDIILEEGVFIYRGEPNGSEYFTTKETIKSTGANKSDLFQGLQEQEHPKFG